VKFEVDPRWRYTLIVPEGVYESDTLLGLIVSVLAHRFHHLVTQGRWRD